MNDKHENDFEKTQHVYLIGVEHAYGLKLLLLLAFIILIEVLYEYEIFQFFLDKKRLIDFLDSLGPLSFISFILLQALQVVAAPIPGEVTGLAGGFIYGPFFGIILSTIGLTLGSFLAFSLSRWLGKPFVQKVVRKEIFERFDYILKLSHHKGAFLVFLLFLIPGFPKDYLCYILGLGPISFKEFFIISTAGRFSGTVLLTLGGAFIRKQQYREFFLLIGIAIIIVLICMAYRDKIERLLQKLSPINKTPPEDKK
jgi:uncharacterized membrane protein YdjX (TVP38/TMEM64 family)